VTATAARWAAGLSIVTLWFVLLGYRDLMDPDEGRYAEIPREMVASGDWLTPRLQGLKYFEKPPLQYWTTAAALRAFGASAWAARLSTAVFGIAGVLWVWWLGRRLWGRDAGDFASLIACSGLLYFVMGHLLTLDMALTFFLALGIGSLALAQHELARPRRARNWMLLGWAALAGAVLTKGLVGLVLPAGAVGAYVLWQRDWALLQRLHLGKGVMLLALLCVPWFVAVSLANHDFARFFFVHEHLERFTTTEHHRGGPFYYFLGIFLLGAVPWVTLAIAALLRPGFAWRGGAAAFEPQRLFWLYVVVVLLFFSISRSKLPAYILPVWPFVALLAGRHAAAVRGVGVDGWVAIAMAALLVVGLFMLPSFASDTTPLELLQAGRPWVFGAALCMLGAGCVLLGWRGSPRAAVAAAALAAMLSWQMLLWGTQVLGPSRSGHDIAQQIRQLELPPATPIYLVGAYSPSLAFYLQQTIQIVDYAGELRFGRESEPERTIGTTQEFARRWRADGQAVAVISTEHHGRYLHLGLAMQEVRVWPRYAVFVKHAEGQPADHVSGGAGVP